MSQLVAADRTVWQMMLEEGVQPKRDETGTLALDSKLMESLQSYRVSFSLLPLIAKKEPANSPTKSTKTHVSHGGKGSNFQVQKPWIKQKGGKKGGKGKVRVPTHIFKLGGTASNPAGEAICFGFNSSSGCSEAADGAKCRRGLHICAKCYGAHGIQKHESA